MYLNVLAFYAKQLPKTLNFACNKLVLVTN